VTRVYITEDEQWPVYGIIPVDQTTGSKCPDAGVEADQTLIDEYNQARDAWDAVQSKLRALARASRQET